MLKEFEDPLIGLPIEELFVVDDGGIHRLSDLVCPYVKRTCAKERCMFFQECSKKIRVLDDIEGSQQNSVGIPSPIEETERIPILSSSPTSFSFRFLVGDD